MIVYMLKHLGKKLYYRRGQKVDIRWVKQKDASIWTNKRGIAAAKSQARSPCEIVSFTLEKI